MGAPDPADGPDTVDAADDSDDAVDRVEAVVGDVGDGAAAALRALLTHSVAGLAVWDTDLRCIWDNDAFERVDGIDRGRRITLLPACCL
ncbi:hypothetical protein ACIHCM_26435 [Streptomyces sp. NPDC052023]|uniref:hypothetical protein n=1 Tax=Streptomyces sp. NPDC052023 TaxID=3365681 RepID=UPI0037CF0129